MEKLSRFNFGSRNTRTESPVLETAEQAGNEDSNPATNRDNGAQRLRMVSTPSSQVQCWQSRVRSLRSRLASRTDGCCRDGSPMFQRHRPLNPVPWFGGRLTHASRSFSSRGEFNKEAIKSRIFSPPRASQSGTPVEGSTCMPFVEVIVSLVGNNRLTLHPVILRLDRPNGMGERAAIVSGCT